MPAKKRPGRRPAKKTAPSRRRGVQLSASDMRAGRRAGLGAARSAGRAKFKEYTASIGSKAKFTSSDR